jgi:hypothetical protein
MNIPIIPLRCAAVALAAALWVGLTASPALAQEAPLELPAPPAAPAATNPSSRAATMPSPASVLAAPLQKITDAMELSYPEKQLLIDTDDRVGPYYDPAAFMLLAHIDRIGPLTAAEMNLLQPVPWKMLIKYGGDFRGEPMRMSLQVYSLTRLDAGQNVPYSSYWDHRRPLWRMACVNVGGSAPGAEPIIVISTQDPREVLGEGKQQPDNRTWTYGDAGRPVTVAAVFYKVVRESDYRGTAVHDYPVLLAWQVQGPAAQKFAWPEPSLLLVTGVPVLVLALLIFLWYRARRRGGAVQWQRLRAQEDHQTSQPPAEPETVDPSLRAAIEDLKRQQKESGDAGGANRAG